MKHSFEVLLKVMKIIKYLKQFNFMDKILFVPAPFDAFYLSGVSSCSSLKKRSFSDEKKI